MPANKKKKNIILISAAVLVFAALAVWVLCTWLDYLSVKIVYDIDEREYAEICGEYLLDPQTADIEYVFSAGRDLRGVRLLLSENDLRDMNAVFSERVFEDGYSDYFKLKESGVNVTSRRSDRTEKEVCCPRFSEAVKRTAFCYVFESGGRYYMEIEKY